MARILSPATPFYARCVVVVGRCRDMNSVIVWSDIACPWAHIAVSRLHRYRDRLGLAERVAIDHRAFPLELVNGRPTPKRILDAEVPVAQSLEPDAGWQVWQRPAFEWPVTTLVALEAVQAVKLTQGIEASERLDRALRRALFAESRCISMMSEVLKVADECEGVMVDDLEGSLYRGVARRNVIDQWHEAVADGSGVKGSPHLFFPEGTDAHNPGIEMHWNGEHGEGFPIIDCDDPSVYENLLACFKRAA
jgi:predicted DsbA family dithiol-disulfide isomerase